MRDLKIAKSGESYAVQITASDDASEFSRSEDDLWNEINKVQRFANIVYHKADDRKKDVFEAIYHSADMGLRKGKIQTGQSNLEIAKSMISDDYPAFRKKIWIEYAKAAGFGIFILMPIGFAFYLSETSNWLDLNSEQIVEFKVYYDIVQAFFWVPAGVLIGIFLQFIVSVGDSLNFKIIEALNPAKWTPLENIVNNIFVSLLFTFLLGVKLIQVGLFGYLLNDFREHAYLCPIIGLLTGVAYTFVRDMAYKLQPTKK